MRVFYRKLEAVLLRQGVSVNSAILLGAAALAGAAVGWFGLSLACGQDLAQASIQFFAAVISGCVTGSLCIWLHVCNSKFTDD